ncbi:MAG: NAD(P)-dependent oxidoreductase [Solirubrobacteraceae bacterium]
MAAETDTKKPRVGMLGTGLMGSAMATRMLEQGIDVIAWDHTAEHVSALEEAGGTAARSPEEVVADASIVITMLPTAQVVLSVVEPLLSDWPEGTIWVQMSSVGAGEADQLTRVAQENGVTIVDAPVSGSTHPAQEGRLTILASGPDSVREQLQPVFAALSSRVMWVGQAGMGSRLKLAANHWMIASVTAVAETMHLCEAMGLDQQPFVELLDDGPLGSPYIREKLSEMRSHEYPPGFPVRLALKDLELVGEVEAASGAEMPVLDTTRECVSAAAREHADEDLGAVYEAGWRPVSGATATGS